MMSNDKPFNLGHEALRGFVQDINLMLIKTLVTMREKGAQSAEINSKLTIDFNNKSVQTFGTGDDESRRTAIIPEFKHKVASKVETKADVTGIYDAGDSEIIYDDKLGVILKKIESAQMSMFDGDDDDDETSESAEDKATEQPLQLFGETKQEPIDDDVIDAEYREAEGEGESERYVLGDYYDDGYGYDEAL